MRADVAIGKGAEDCIGERVERHVGVGVAGEGLDMRNTDSAQSDMVARSEGMHIQTRAGTDVAETGRLDRFRARSPQAS